MYLYDFGIRLGTTTKTEDLHMAGRSQKGVLNNFSFVLINISEVENTDWYVFGSNFEKFWKFCKYKVGNTVKSNENNLRKLRCCLQPISFLFSNAHWAHLLKEIGTWINWYVGCALCFSFWGCTQLKVTLRKKDSYMCSEFWFLLLRQKKHNEIWGSNDFSCQKQANVFLKQFCLIWTFIKH